MIYSKMIEKEEDLHCSLKHQLPILMVNCDANLKKNERLLCPECMENLESIAQLMSFKKINQYIQEIQNYKKEYIEDVIKINTKQIEQLQKEFQKLKSNVIQQLDILTGNIDEWIKNVQIIGQENVTYSFFDELENIISKTKANDFNQNLIIDQINQINQTWYQKIIIKLNFENELCDDILKQLGKLDQIKENILKSEKLQILQNHEQNQFKKQQIMDEQVELKLIDDSNKQSSKCNAIVFDSTGSIMISCDKEQIKIWNLDQGRFTKQSSYTAHKSDVTCLEYSKNNNNFISGSLDKKIICWKQINQKEWKFSEPYECENKIYCFILNKQEDQLILGGVNLQIQIWQVDFIKNEMSFLYSLDKHGNSIFSLSFNQYETVLVSCGYHEFILWEKGLEGKWEYKDILEQIKYLLINLLQCITQHTQIECSKNEILLLISPKKIIFTHDQQLLWVPLDLYINDLFVFESQNGAFQLNSSKTITLIRNHQCQDSDYFPILYNKDRNIIMIRHKHHIYLIRELNDLRLLQNQIFNVMKFMGPQPMMDNIQFIGIQKVNNIQHMRYYLNKSIGIQK
ncbi:unnamed protein product [Paramecium octaurelia]|uniref:Uncharacterized protein n=1 Tax=Paramecium octaurelia TaxID=43137 RepID=A0A8S1X9Y4_PAROT|nr:unnamed protein product [Paramecium octaurelia]